MSSVNHSITVHTGYLNKTIDQTLDILRSTGQFFDYGDSLVMVRDGSVELLNDADLLRYRIVSLIAFNKLDKSKPSPQNKKPTVTRVEPPVGLFKGILSLKEGRNLRKLKAVITAPIITAEDHIIEKVGYDEKTQLYLALKQDPLPVPNQVNKEMALEAVRTLMSPFASFPFDSAVDRSVLLAALLTALLRPSLDLAPAFAIDAPKQGTGKTFLAKCIGAFSTGEVPAVYSAISQNEDEVRKRLFAILLGGEKVILWDNVVGALDGMALASFLTTEEYQERILGTSKTMRLPNRSLFLMTGNNFQLKGDMPRRVLTCRLDSRLENPTLRSFTGNPLRFIQENRLKLTQQALTLIRGYLQSSEHKSGGVKADKLASFEQWDTLVRQVVAWVALSDKNYVDPKQVIDEALLYDPEQDELDLMLSGIHEHFKNNWFSAKELCDYASTADCPEELSEVLRNMVKGGRFNSIAVGVALAERKNRIAHDLELIGARRTPGSKKAAQYKVEKTGSVIAMG